MTIYTKILTPPLSVTPTWQNQGVANVLLHTAEEYARSTWQAQHMRLWVIKQRPELAAYYQRRGYQFTGATLPFPDDSRYGIPKVAGGSAFSLWRRH
jgi:GNAT superfamily N-acetyltransferase